MKPPTEEDLGTLRGLLLGELRGRTTRSRMWDLESLKLRPVELIFPETYNKKLLQTARLELDEALAQYPTASPVERVIMAAADVLGEKYEPWKQVAASLQDEDTEATEATGMSTVELLKLSVRQAAQAKLKPASVLTVLSPGSFFELWYSNFCLPRLKNMTGAERRMMERTYSMVAMWGCSNLEFEWEPDETVSEFAMRCLAIASHVSTGIWFSLDSVIAGSPAETVFLLDKVRR